MGLYTTIDEGQKAAVYHKTGKIEIVSGPARIFTFSAEVRPLSRFIASELQYLELLFLDGRRENRRGPCSEWLNPLVHSSIYARDGTEINSQEVLVVYRTNEKTGQVERHIIPGPTLHIPTPNEYVHQFKWHGSPSHGNPGEKVPGALQFTKLRVIADQFYNNVSDVRTCDDALLTVKLMIFFKLVDIEKMLNQTHDPVADFINAVCADVVTFASTLTYEEFLEKTSCLSELTSYPQLCSRSEGIGFQIHKVVYRGYFASTRLQEMHDTAIQARTRLRLEAETEKQAQELADLKLNREFERDRLTHEKEEAVVVHQAKLLALRTNEQRKQRLEDEDAKLLQERARCEMVARNEQESYNRQLSFFKELKGMGVELTKYLVSQAQGGQPRLHVVSEGSDMGMTTNPLALHVHTNKTF
eukprot:TRINITY_DN356_c0_g1::TRINITY_DN356_c0_g1_i1::g.7451::m.7451 TRINITY_DN356_c0_g1::TRINITY_DN356_c0_g1_i1::g.7451  ORF type:complete len:415 (+),score=86.43,Band_7/PF01145.20/3.3e+02,Band_7/PF01145.20/0.00054 TRINITY_DN356_c0_g1_i1:123-1367(+)